MGKIVLTKPTFLFLFLAVTGIGLTIGAAFVLGVSGIEAQQAFADLIDFETGFADSDPVTAVVTATNVVTFGVEPCGAPGTAFIAETGTPTTAYVPTDDIPTGASGSFFLTDETAGPSTSLDYCISFATPVNNLSVDLYDYRTDGGASVGDVATLTVFDAGGSPVGSVTFTITAGLPDPNLATLSIQSPTGLISSAELSFSVSDKGTGIDNIDFTTNIVPPPMQVYELSEIVKIDSGSRFSTPYSLICFEGDWLNPPASFVADPLVLIRDTVQTAVLEGASKSKVIGLQGSAELQDMHAFDVEVTVTILCLSPGPIQVYEVSVTVPIGISDNSVKPVSLRCSEGDLMYVSDTISSSFVLGSNPEGVAGGFGDLSFLKDGNKIVGLEGLAQGSLQLFEYELTITIVCLSPAS